MKHTADIITTINDKLVLIDRKKTPPGYALPGGHLEEHESLEECARRELQEETTLQATALKQFRTYSKPGRDPRGRCITTVFICESEGTPDAQSDAKSIVLLDLKDLETHKDTFAFDHYDILMDYKNSLKTD